MTYANCNRPYREQRNGHRTSETPFRRMSRLMTGLVSDQFGGRALPHCLLAITSKGKE